MQQQGLQLDGDVQTTPQNFQSIAELRQAAAQCLICPWAQQSTQTVCGEGPPSAQVMFIGEQPGDMEDLEGRPFVGPAGKLFDEACLDAGLNRADIYLTNAVKHFKWEPRGKRRIHQRPNSGDVKACKVWLLAEVALVRPKLIVCLGVTAATAAFGKVVTLHHVRGQLVDTPLSSKTWVTTHPSAILRAPDEATRRVAYSAFVNDLRRVTELVDMI